MDDKQMDAEFKKMQESMEPLRQVPERQAEAAARGRAAFLRRGAALRTASLHSQSSRKPRSGFAARGRAWQASFARLAIAVVMALGVFFGGGALAVYAAGPSLPGQVLYPVKTFSEDAVLSLTRSPHSRLNYALEFSDRRVQEISALMAAGKPIPEGVLIRWQDELDLALESAATLNDPELIGQMEHMNQRANAQGQVVSDLARSAHGSQQVVLEEAQSRLDEQMELTTLGQTNPEGFREQVRLRWHGGNNKLPGERGGNEDGNNGNGNGNGGGDGNGGGGTWNATPEAITTPASGATPEPASTPDVENDPTSVP